MRAIVCAGVFLGLVGGIAASSGCSGGSSTGPGAGGSGGGSGGPAGSGGGTPRFTLTSTFGHLETIPTAYTCAGDDLSPPFEWTSPPAATEGFALLLTDLEPTIPVTQWIVWEISAGARSLPGGLPEMPVNGVPLSNQKSYKTDSRGYAGPCPNGARHKYLFRLYALDSAGLPGVTLDSTLDEIEDVILDRLIDFADLVGVSEASQQ
jgi:Raf kinase inhibitor-like YbhB/YbcL family protein